MVDSCRKFVTMKYRIDDFLDTMWQRFHDFEAVAFYGMEWLIALGQDASLNDRSWLMSRCPEFFKLEPRIDSLKYSLSPDTYATIMLPHFSDDDSVRSSDFKLRDVDPSLVIGSSYYRGDGFSSEDEQDRALDRINEQVGSGSPYGNCAYVTVGALPLHIAHEGKNRVRAFLNAGRSIRAWVGPARFPEAAMLQLCRIKQPESPYADQSQIYILFDLQADSSQVIPYRVIHCHQLRFRF